MIDAQAAGGSRDSISRALRDLADQEEELALPESEETRELRLGYADALVARIVLRLMPDRKDQERLLLAVGEGVGAAIQFIQASLVHWLDMLPEGVLHELE